MRRNEWCTFFRRAIHLCRDHLTVPMQLLGGIGVVVDLNGGGLIFFETQQRSWELTVIRYRRDDMLWRDFNRTCSNTQDVIRCSFF
jgi:hypothetical protein